MPPGRTFAVCALVTFLEVGLGVAASPSEAAFAGQNGRIAFESTRDGGESEIYTVNADGSDPRRLTFTAAAESHAQFSPDGTKIVFGSERDGNEEIYVMNADGSGQTRLTNNPAEDGHPTFSPDGSRITFYSDRNAPPGPVVPAGRYDEIYVMNADGSGQTRLTFNEVLDRNSSWSPDGSKIVYGSATDIWIMNPDGTGRTQLTTHPAIDLRPDFSPDGTKIVFDSTRDSPPGPPSPGGFNFEIYVMNVDGSGQTRITNSPAADFVGKFSPDGTKMTFMSNRDTASATGFEIYTMNVDGSAQTNITNNPAGDATPDWGRVPDLAAPPPPAPPPQPSPAPARPAAGFPTLFTAKLALARATINRRDRLIDVLAPITRRASGRVSVQLHAAGRRSSFTAPVDSRDGRIRFRRPIAEAQAQRGTGIVTVAYAGDADTSPQTVRLRAASRPAELRLARPTISGGRLRASGTVSEHARGVVRVQLQYVVAGETHTRQVKTPIRDGRWSLDELLSQTVRTAIAQRTGSVHSYTLFTGYYDRRIRGEMRSLQVLGPP